MEELKNLIKLVSEHTGLDITKRTRKREYVEARSVYYKLAKSKSNTLSSIAKSIGFNHATVLHSLNSFFLIEKYNKDLYSLYLSLNIDDQEEEYIEIKNELILLKRDYQVLLDNYNMIKSKDTYIEDTYNSLSDENKSIFKFRAEAILKMMTS